MCTVIDEKIYPKVQVFDNIRFVRDDKTLYYKSCKGLYMHRYVWSFYNGCIDKNYHIHHIDHNKANNGIENLELISCKEHLSMHGKEIPYDEAVKRMDYARIFASKWHSSEKGLEWHREHYQKTKDKLLARVDKKCDFCGTIFSALDNNVSRFCSNKCKSAYRRKMGYDNVTRKCEFCGAEFTANKYTKTTSCSRKCSTRLWRSKKKQGLLNKDDWQI